MDRIEWGAGTPGPWKAVDCGNGAEWDVIKPDPTTIEGHWFVSQCFDSADGGSVETNARAIAEVPAMVAELRRMIGECSNEECEQCERHRAILARIDGGSNG